MISLYGPSLSLVKLIYEIWIKNIAFMKIFIMFFYHKSGRNDIIIIDVIKRRKLFRTIPSAPEWWPITIFFRKWDARVE